MPELLGLERSLRHPNARAERFRITMGCDTVYPWLPALIARLSTEAPLLRCEVVPELTRSAVGAVVKGQVDAAVVPNVKPDPRVSVRHAFEEDIVVVMRKVSRTVQEWCPSLRPACRRCSPPRACR